MTPLLAQRVRADRSFERIYQRHVGDVYRYALAVLRHPADAEDVTQTTFLNAYRAFERGERPRSAHNWLIAIAHNVCRQRFRQTARRPEEVSYDDGIADVVPEDEHGPTIEDVQRALGYLAFNQRAALVMRELEGRSYAEIAEMLELSTGAVETLIFRARRALREQLEGSLTCAEAERAISRRADGRLPRSERGALRAHLRECKECERLARSQRAQRSAFKALAVIPIPSSLTSLFGGGSAAGGAVAAKAAAVVAAGTIATGVAYDGTQRPELTGAQVREPVAATPVERALPVATPVAPSREGARGILEARPDRRPDSLPAAVGRGNGPASLPQQAAQGKEKGAAASQGAAGRRAAPPAAAQRPPQAATGRSQQPPAVAQQNEPPKRAAPQVPRKPRLAVPAVRKPKVKVQPPRARELELPAPPPKLP